jgi:hypothetical protein
MISKKKKRREREEKFLWNFFASPVLPTVKLGDLLFFNYVEKEEKNCC